MTDGTLIKFPLFLSSDLSYNIDLFYNIQIVSHIEFALNFRDSLSINRPTLILHKIMQNI